MKKLAKLFVFMGIFNLIMLVGVFGWLAFSLVIPSFEGTGITVVDFFKDEIDQEKLKKFEENIYTRSEKLGSETARKFVDKIEIFFPNPNFSYSNMQKSEYPFPEVNYNKELEKVAEKALNKALQDLNETDVKNKAARN